MITNSGVSCQLSVVSDALSLSKCCQLSVVIPPSPHLKSRLNIKEREMSFQGTKSALEYLAVT
ncbi:hypothetical protein JYQ62_24220 [Nostoc sp. UHCC 0702]|nr:hypothetical protein JYQ62_24220 [Nostoc sp. UHCC 0702]